MKWISILFGASLLGLGLTACMTRVPQGVQPVEGFELDRYLGRWHEIARLDHRFERGMTDVTADYELSKPGVVRVTNRGFLPGKAEPKIAVGKAKFIGPPSTGSLKVSFFGPFYGGYHIIALDKEGYQYAMVAGPSRGYLWILSRKSQMDEQLYRELTEQARRAGFPVDALIRVTHERGK